MANQQDLEPGTQWIEVADFRPGIYTSAYSETQVDDLTAPNAPLGAAVAEGTAGCVASATGALVPGPRWINKYDNAYDNAYTNYTMGSAILSPVSATLDSTIDDQPDWLCVGRLGFTPATHPPDLDLWAIFSTHYMGAGLGSPANGVNAIHMHPVNGTSVTEPLGGLSVAAGLSDKGPIVITPPTGNFAAYPFFFCGSSNWIDFTNVSGPPQSDNLDACYVFPNPDTAGPDEFAVLFGTQSGVTYGGGNYHGILNTMHQGRLVWATTASYLFPLTVNSSPSVIWSRAFDIIKYSANANVAAIDAEFPSTAAYLSDGSGIALMASMDANTLLVIKNHHGGYLIRGDLDRPQVTRLAGITSTMGKTSLGVMTPLGFVYGARDGMFAWGGDTSSASSYLSPQMPGTFWTSDPKWPGDLDPAYAPEAPLGKFNYRQPFILAPSDFLYDTRIQSWWKLYRPPAPDPDAAPDFYGHATWGYEVSSNGNVYALTTHQVTDTDAMWNYYDFSLPSQNYNWKSQPIPLAKDRNLKCREVGVKIEGIGVVTINIYGYSGNLLFSHSFSSTNDTPQSYRKNCAFSTSNAPDSDSANDVVVEILAVGEQPAGLDTRSGGAPVVHGFRLGVDQDHEIRAE